MENAQSNPILDFVTELDPTNDELWTADGLPKVEVVQKGLGHDEITRKDITNAAPTFSRETQRIARDEAAKAAAPEPASGKQPVVADGARDEKPIAAAPEPDVTDEAPQPSEPEPAVAKVDPDPKLVAESPVDDKGLPEDQPELDRLEGELAVKTVLMNDAQKKATIARTLADTLSNEVNTLNRRIDALIKHDPNANTSGVRAYLKQQHKNREERAAGIKRFVAATSMDPRDVSKALGPAPIDAAMRARKPSRGAARPNWPAAQRANS